MTDDTTDWAAHTTRFTKTIKAKDGGCVAEVEVTEVSLSGCGLWNWTIVMAGIHSYAGGGQFRTPEDARAAADEALPLFVRLYELKTRFIVHKEPTEEVDMAGRYGCLICESSKSPCLHPAKQVRDAFALALRLGRHVPG